MEAFYKRKRFKVGTVIIIAFLLIYIPSLLRWAYSSDIRTDIIMNGSIEDSINIEGCFVRDEEVIKSPYTARCVFEAGEGEKIPANFRVAVILNKTYEKLNNDLTKLDAKILDIQKQKFEKQDFFSEDLSKIDGEIGSTIGNIIDETNSNSLIKTRDYTEDIDGCIRKKAEIIGNTGITDMNLKSKMKERENLQQKINQNRNEVYSRSSGIISYTVDGYESRLNYNSIQDITPKFLDSIKTGNSAKDSGNGMLIAGKPFAKVIKDVECYIVAEIEPQKAAKLKVDDNVVVRFNEIGKEVEGLIYYKSNEMEGKYIIAIKIDKGISETAGMRKTSIDIIKCPFRGISSYKGLKVPLSSLRNLDIKKMTARIILIKANYASERDVKIVMKNNEDAIISSNDKSGNKGVSLYDEYIVNPGNIQEGQLIRK